MRYYLQWMLKSIQIKLIHILGGYTKDEYNSYSNFEFIQGLIIRNNQIKVLADELYGADKQTWIDAIYKELLKY